MGIPTKESKIKIILSPGNRVGIPTGDPRIKICLSVYLVKLPCGNSDGRSKGRNLSKCLFSELTVWEFRRRTPT